MKKRPDRPKVDVKALKEAKKKSKIKAALGKGSKGAGPIKMKKAPMKLTAAQKKLPAKLQAIIKKKEAEEKSMATMKKAAMKLKDKSAMMMKKAAMKMKKVSAMKMKAKSMAKMMKKR